MSKDHTRAVFIVSFGRLLQAVLSIVSVRVATTLLSPTEIGRARLISSALSWFLLFLIAPVGQYIFRCSVEWHTKGRLREYLLLYWPFYLLSVAVLTGIFLVFLELAGGIGTSIAIGWLFLLASNAAFLNRINSTIVRVLNLLGYRLWFTILLNIASWTGLGLSILLVQLHPSAEFWLSGSFLAQVLVLPISILIFLKVTEGKVRLPDKVFTLEHRLGVKTIFQFAWPVSVYSIFYWLQDQGYRFIISMQIDEATVGLFAVGFGIGIAPILAFDNLLQEYYHPIFYQAIANSDISQRCCAWKLYIRFVFPSIVLMLFFIASAVPIFGRLMVGPAFRSVVWLGTWGAIYRCTMTVNGVLNMAIYAQKRTYSLIKPTASGAFISVIMVFLTIRLVVNPLLGISLSLVIGALVNTVYMWLLVEKQLPVGFPWRRVGLAVLASIPIVIWFQGAMLKISNFSVFISLFVLSVGGLMMLVGQLAFARRQLFSSSQTIML